MTLRITGDSMAPTLLGEHRKWCCVDCGYQHFAATSGPLPTCFNCGSSTPPPPPTLCPGDQVQLDRDAGDVQMQRGDLVAARGPRQQFVVKRVVGLPGERVAIQNGRLLINDARLPQVQAQRTPWVVHDDRFRRDHQSRWHSVGESSWVKATKGFEISATKHSSEPGVRAGPKGELAGLPETRDRPAWLEYRHPTQFAGQQPGQILDAIPYNTLASRPLHPVADVAVDGVAQILPPEKKPVETRNPSGHFLLRYSLLGREWQCDYDLASQTVCVRNAVTSAALSPTNSPGGKRLPLDHFTFRIERAGDRITFWVNDERMGDQALPLNGPEQAVGEFSIGAVQVNARVSELIVRRANYVTLDAPRHVANSVWQLGTDEYFLLGDNSPVSDDSRTWSALKRDQLLGKLRPLPK